MGIIYLYTFPNNKRYIGQTRVSLARRTIGHISEAKLTPDGGCIALNHAINYYGRDNFKQEILLECNDVHLDDYESKFIDMYDSLSPNGYNLKAGGNSSKHNESTIAKRAISLRKKEEDKDLPQHTKTEIKRGLLRYRINNHPKCSNASFNTRDEMLIFLEKLETGEIAPIIAVPRKVKTTPKYILERKNGYVITYKDEVLKSVLDKNKPKEELLALAEEWVEKLKETGKIK